MSNDVARTCRTHGGIFYSPKRRGRPPVKCTSENLCTRAPEYKNRQAQGVAHAVARTLKGAQPKSKKQATQLLKTLNG